MKKIKDYEQVLICAARYALGTAGKSEAVTDYIAKELPKLSDECIAIMIIDIEKSNSYCTYVLEWSDWSCLKEQLEEEMEKRYGRKTNVCKDNS